jgi:hypothetical protein
MAQMPLSDWKQWERERPSWAGGVIEDAFWNFVDQKWNDSLNVAAAELASWDQGADHRRGPDGHKKGEGEKPAAKKAPITGVHTATVSGTGAGDGATPKGPERVPRKWRLIGSDTRL